LWFFCCVLWYFFLLSELIKYSLIVFFVLFGSRFVSWCWCVRARVFVHWIWSGIWNWFWIAGIVTRRPLVLQLHKIEDGEKEYAEFLHRPGRKITDFGNVVVL
jgi:hypothetical protein